MNIKTVLRKCNIIRVVMVSVISVSLYGCVIPPTDSYQDSGKHHKHHHDDYSKAAGNHSHYITRDGVTLPPCDEIPDASQADNGNRCWIDE